MIPRYRKSVSFRPQPLSKILHDPQFRGPRAVNRLGCKASTQWRRRKDAVTLCPFPWLSVAIRGSSHQAALESLRPPEGTAEDTESREWFLHIRRSVFSGSRPLPSRSGHQSKGCRLGKSLQRGGNCHQSFIRDRRVTYFEGCRGLPGGNRHCRRRRRRSAGAG